MIGNGDGRVAVVHGIGGFLGELGNSICTCLLLGRTGSGQRSLPVGTGDILGDLTVGHIVKLIDCGGIVAGAGIALIIDDRILHGVIPAVNDIVGISHQLDLVRTRIQHIAAVLQVIVGGHILHGEGHSHRFTGSGVQQTGLAKAGQHHMALLDAAHSVGRRIVDLHHILAGYIAGVGHLDLHGDGGIVGSKIRDGLFKGGVAQAVAEGILHHGLVGVLVAGAGGVVDPAGLIKAIAHIDALGVLEVIAVFQVGVGKHTCIPVGRRGGEIIGVGVGQTAGGVHLTGEHLAHCVHAGRTGSANPQRSVDALLFQKAQLHGVGSVQQHNDLVKVLCLDQFQQIFFILGQFQIMAAVVGVAVTGRVHVLGQVIALTAGAGDHHYRHAGKRPGGGHEVIGILAGGNLGRGEICAAETGGFRAADAGIAVKIHQILVDGKSRIGQALDQVHVVGVIASTAAGAAVNRIDAGIAEEIDGLTRGKRQGIFLVFQQDNALALQFLRHVTAGLLGLVRRQGERMNLGVCSPRQAGVQVGRHKGVDGREEHAAGNVGDECDDGHNGHNHHRQPPLGCFLFHMVSPFFLLFACLGNVFPCCCYCRRNSGANLSKSGKLC